MFKSKIAILLISILLYNCSDDNTTVKEISEPKDIKVNSFSKEYAYIGEQVSILGENFVTNKSDVKVFLDDKEINISLLTDNTITFSIPKGTSQSPKLRIEILNLYIYYNNSYKDLVVLDNVKGKWIEVSNNLDVGSSIRNLKSISKEEIYFSRKTEYMGFEAISLINGGANVKWFEQDYRYSENRGGGFHIGNTGTEYSMRGTAIYYTNPNKKNKVLYEFGAPDVIPEHISNNGVIVNFWPLDFFINKEENKFVFSTSNGKIYKAENGVIENIYQNENSFTYEYDCFYANSIDEMWLGGYLYDQGTLNYRPAQLLYLKNGQWHKKTLTFEGKESNFEKITQIKFIDKLMGYAVVGISNKIGVGEKYLMIKSSDGGDNFEVIRKQDSKITGFSFKDKNIGWFVSDNKIYKTNDGGHTWKLDYTNDSNCKGVLYNEGVVWVIADKKVLKYYL